MRAVGLTGNQEGKAGPGLTGRQLDSPGEGTAVTASLPLGPDSTGHHWPPLSPTGDSLAPWEGVS